LSAASEKDAIKEKRQLRAKILEFGGEGASGV
jgi:hypothetical protein